MPVGPTEVRDGGPDAPAVVTPQPPTLPEPDPRPCDWCELGAPAPGGPYQGKGGLSEPPVVHAVPR